MNHYEESSLLLANVNNVIDAGVARNGSSKP
jgi:hypothetical protein